MLSIALITITRHAEILTGPHTQVVAPGETAYFVCHARGDSVYWYINNTDPHPQRDYEAMGFSFSYFEFPHAPQEPEEHNNTITVEARPSNNGTVIGCTAVGTYSNQHDFEEGSLIIAGIDNYLTCYEHVSVAKVDF